jgi:VIT1/CCC1 family predicted Fe2+/Mn2+ transporter
MEPDLKKRILVYQRNEITEHHIYQNLADTVSTPDNCDILREIAEDELRHYHIWKKQTQEEVKPDRVKIWVYTLIGRVLGFTFGVNLMERGEEDAQESYSQLRGIVPEIDAVIRDENKHEDELLKMLDEERLHYTGSMVLGLSDALVELTGTLAGLTLALQDTQLIALSASITGIAAALSMGASEYLSTKSEQSTKAPLKAALYTGSTYLLTVILLVLPYLLLENFYVCLALALTTAVILIGIFNYYVAIAKDEPFRPRFLEMSGLTLGVATLSFFIGSGIRRLLGIEV